MTYSTNNEEIPFAAATSCGLGGGGLVCLPGDILVSCSGLVDYNVEHDIRKILQIIFCTDHSL